MCRSTFHFHFSLSLVPKNEERCKEGGLIERMRGKRLFEKISRRNWRGWRGRKKDEWGIVDHIPIVVWQFMYRAIADPWISSPHYSTLLQARQSQKRNVKLATVKSFLFDNRTWLINPDRIVTWSLGNVCLESGSIKYARQFHTSFF